MPSFKDKVVIVTGASAGIGAHTAIEFVKAGASVVLVARGKDGLDDTADKCQKAGATKDQILVLPADLTDEVKVQQVVQDTIDKFGKIDVVVNIAGANVKGGIETVTLDEVQTSFEVCTKVAYRMTQACIPHLVKTKGNIVNMSSIGGSTPIPMFLAGCMSRAAAESLTKCTALELGSRGVRVNAVCPGFIENDVFARSGIVDPEHLPKFLEKMAGLHPLNRNGQQQEVAAAILFLASDDASFTTGCCFPVDGGLCITSSFPTHP